MNLYLIERVQRVQVNISYYHYPSTSLPGSKFWKVQKLYSICEKILSYPLVQDIDAGNTMNSFKVMLGSRTLVPRDQDSWFVMGIASPSVSFQFNTILLAVWSIFIHYIMTENKKK